MGEESSLRRRLGCVALVVSVCCMAQQALSQGQGGEATAGAARVPSADQAEASPALAAAQASAADSAEVPSAPTAAAEPATDSVAADPAADQPAAADTGEPEAEETDAEETGEAVADPSQDPALAAAMEAGHTEYLKNCRACHGSKGTAGVPLAGNYKVEGGYGYLGWAIITGPGYMPEFAEALSDEQIAQICTYILNSWGNSYGIVTAEDIASLR